MGNFVGNREPSSTVFTYRILDQNRSNSFFLGTYERAFKSGGLAVFHFETQLPGDVDRVNGRSKPERRHQLVRECRGRATHFSPLSFGAIDLRFHAESLHPEN